MAGKFKVVKVDDNGRRRTVASASTPEKAREIAQAERAQRMHGSSESFEVREGEK